MNKMQIVKGLEAFSAIGFGLAYWRYDLQMATTVLMVLMTLFVASALILKVPLTRLQWGTWAIIVVLGVATLMFKDDRFIKWKSTIVNGGLSLALLLSHFFGKKTIVERLVAEKIKAPREKLRRVNFAAALHLSCIAGLNLFFAYQFETTVWVNFKLFGIMILNFMFLMGAFYYLRAYLKEFFEDLQKN